MRTHKSPRHTHAIPRCTKSHTREVSNARPSGPHTAVFVIIMGGWRLHRETNNSRTSGDKKNETKRDQGERAKCVSNEQSSHAVQNHILMSKLAPHSRCTNSLSGFSFSLSLFCLIWFYHFLLLLTSLVSALPDSLAMLWAERIDVSRAFCPSLSLHCAEK